MTNISLRQFLMRPASLISVGVFVLVLNLCGCRQPASPEPKIRPAGVPRDALWVGGADGGAYVRCSVDVAHNVNPCSVWNDYTGQLVESGNYRLLKEDRAAKESELHIAFPDFAGLIYLEGGLVLKRLA
jgi:hypothetical protein